MFISSLILTASPIAWADECVDERAECRDGETRPLIILEPTSSPGTEEGRERDAPPPVVIVPREPAPPPEADDDDDDVEVFVTDRKPKKDRDDRRRAQLVGQYALQFLGDGPAHHLLLRHYGQRDSYFGAELRYMPVDSSIVWFGRVGAGVDLLGGSPFDIQLGLFAGSAGEWFVLDGGDALYHSPIAGSEVRFAYEGRKLFTSYRLLGGFGVGPLQRWMSEREFMLGYKVTDTLQVFGETVHIDPRSGDQTWSLGLGGRLVF